MMDRRLLPRFGAAAAVAMVMLTCAAPTANALAWPASAFPFGMSVADISVTAMGFYQDEIGWEVDFSDVPMKFYGTQYPLAWTSDNGYVVFGNTFYPYDPSQFGTVGAGAPKAAPFFSDVSLLATDANGDYVGDIKYRLSPAGSNDTAAAASLISRAFSKSAAFTPQKVWVSTWDGVLPGGYAGEAPPDPSKPNSFQVMLAWDASRTFSCFFYPQNGIQWLQASDMNSPAAVGFEEDNAADTYFELLPYSRNVANLASLTTSSNIGEPGTWCFQVDTTIVQGTPPPPSPPPKAMPTAAPLTSSTPTKAPTPAPTKTTPTPAPAVKLSALQTLLAQLQKQLNAYLQSLAQKYKAAKLKPNPTKRTVVYGRRLAL